jgi:hypothetical protein
MDFRDMATRIYRWTGETGRLVGRERAPGEPARGEIRGEAFDQSIYEQTLYARAGLSFAIAPEHVARLSVTPQWVWRVGDDHVPDRVDLLGLHDTMQQVVAGAEYELDAWDARLSNIAFAKLYHARATHEGLPDRSINQEPYEMERSMTHAGAGDALRLRVTEWLALKASYEYTIRLPTSDELFGNGALIESKPSLRPERSHNANVGPRVELKRQPWGDLVLDVNGFLRETTDLIILLGGTQFISYANLADVRSQGVESAIAWDAPGRYVGLDGSFTYQDVRNTTSSGLYSATKGMRVPSRPYMFGAWGARARMPDALLEDDALEAFYYGRYVHAFDRAWAVGDPSFSFEVAAQVSHAVGVTYALDQEFGKLSLTVELDNLTDASLFDVFGVQRPGRSLACKVTGEI